MHINTASFHCNGGTHAPIHRPPESLQAEQGFVHSHLKASQVQYSTVPPRRRPRESPPVPSSSESGGIRSPEVVAVLRRQLLNRRRRRWRWLRLLPLRLRRRLLLVLLRRWRLQWLQWFQHLHHIPKPSSNLSAASTSMLSFFLSLLSYAPPPSKEGTNVTDNQHDDISKDYYQDGWNLNVQQGKQW
jgi:hypothetical protein